MTEFQNESQSEAQSDVLIALGQTVKSHRLALGLSQEELAHRAGLHRTYISDVERGARNVSLITLHRFAGALKITLSQLVTIIDDETRIYSDTTDGAFAPNRQLPS
jgi:transcriptional regulator with XRE-family HTH domain